MTIINTAVNYPVERGGTGKFKALSTVTSQAISISNTSPILITPATGNAILLIGLVASGLPQISITGNLYGTVVDNKFLSTNNLAGAFYLAQNFATATPANVEVLNGLPPIQFETDEVVYLEKGGTAGTANLLLTYQEGYIL